MDDALLMGVVIPGIILSAIFVLPYLFDRKRTGVGVWFNKEGRLAQILVIGIIAGLITLTLIRIL